MRIKMPSEVKVDTTGQYGRRDVKVSIIVRAWMKSMAAYDQTFACLSSLTAACGTTSHVIGVFNESETDDSLYGMVDTAVVLHANYGAVRATNVGLQLAMLDPSEFILVLDNDTRFPEGDAKILDRWMAHFEDENVGAAGAMTDYVSGWQNVEAMNHRYTKKVEKSNQGGPGHTGPIYAPWLISFACMYRKLALQTCPPPEIGGDEIAQRTGNGAFPLKLQADEVQRGWLWDERYEPGNSEDIDISYRLAFRGWKLVVANDVYVHHLGSQSFKELDFKNLVQGNVTKLADKWGLHVLQATGLMRT